MGLGDSKLFMMGHREADFESSWSEQRLTSKHGWDGRWATPAWAMGSLHSVHF